MSDELRDYRLAMLAARRKRRMEAIGGGGGRSGLVAPQQFVTGPAIPMPEPFITGGQIVGSSQQLTMSAAGDSIAAGGDYVTFDTITAQHGFDGVAAAGDSWTHEVGGMYVAFYRHEWASYTGGGTIRIELDGVLVPDGRLIPGGSGRKAIGFCLYRATTGSVGKVKVVHGSTSAQVCDAELQIGISDPDLVEITEPDPGWELLFSADAWGAVFDGTNWWTTEGNSGNTVTKRDAAGVAVSSFDAQMGGRVRGITFDGTDLWVTGNFDETQVTKPSAIKRFNTSGVVQQTINTTTLGFGDSNTGLAFDGSDLWFCEHIGDDLVRVSTAGALELAVASPADPYGVAFYGSRIWVVNRAARLLVAYNLSGVATGATVDLSGLTNAPTGVWIDALGTLYIACDADGVYEYLGVLP